MPEGKIYTIYYIVDRRFRRWVQHIRLQYLKKYLRAYRFRLLSEWEFERLWGLGALRKKYIYFTSWRVAHILIKRNPRIFTDSDFRCFMAAVTSHSNIGGGLDPLNPIPNRTPEEAFDLAIGLLRKFKAVSVNSMILHELLTMSLPNLIYCPNGVDTAFFTPKENKEYNPNLIRIGWVGKEKGPKNFGVVEKALRGLESLGGFRREIIKIPKQFRRAPYSFRKMRDFYNTIDFYLCASLNEGTPNPALEAASSGVPVVTTRVGNMRELIKEGENGFFVDPTVESIVSRFKEIRRIDKEKYNNMSKDARDSIVRDWSWEKRISNFAAAFNELLRD